VGMNGKTEEGILGVEGEVYKKKLVLTALDLDKN